MGLVCVGVIFVGLQKHGGEVLTSVGDADEDEEVIELVPAMKINYVDRRLADKVFSALFVTNSILDRRLHVQQHAQRTQHTTHVYYWAVLLTHEALLDSPSHAHYTRT